MLLNRVLIVIFSYYKYNTFLIILLAVQYKSLGIQERKQILSELNDYYNSDELFDQILTVTSKELDSTPEIIKDRKRNGEFVLARHIVMYLAANYGTFSYFKIGVYLGFRTHATVINGCKHIEKLMKKDPSVTKAVNKIVEELKRL